MCQIYKEKIKTRRRLINERKFTAGFAIVSKLSIHQTLMAHFTLLVSSVREANVLHKEQKEDVVLLYIAGISEKTKNTNQANQEELFV